jgi:hypothetical protein
MHIYGRHAVADLLGDFVAFRNIRPVDIRLPGVADIAPNTQPRKGDDAYAAVAITILNAAQATRTTKPIRQFLMIGDTRQSDGGTYMTIANRSGWHGAAFICDEKRAEDPSLAMSNDTGVYIANRWQKITQFSEQFIVDDQTAIIIDLDKTLIGARGRNHHLIDTARLTALKRAVSDVLGDTYDDVLFSETYHRFNQPRFHRFTGDNQDFLAFICVMAGGAIVTPEALQAMLEQGIMLNFAHFVDLTGARIQSFSSPLAPFHTEFAALYRNGDMTPFKSFRYLEYLETAARFGCAPEGLDAIDILNREICITHEVWAAAMQWKAAGALLFGLSDKPDEAACGTGEGLPIHKLVTHVIGS